MSYLVLARKWRPQTFAEVIGQEPVVRTLQNAITRERVPHAMIFSGVRGVGKTTLARIMAKALNCETGPVPVPCNRCEACREIMAGSAIDLHEIDGASNRGIQEIRELKENIRFFPTRDRYKIIIIDEVHMLTTEAFNALLKTLEEPPAHVFFMFATTELHKIPITILSRCQRYELKRVPFATLADFFGRIAVEEGVTINERALHLIVREAEGSVRDGLSLLDQVFSFGGPEITEDDITQVLGLVDSEVIHQLSQALLAGDLAASMLLLDRAYSFGIDLKRFTNDLLARFRGLIICRISERPEQLLDLADRDLAVLKETAAAHTPETLHQYFQLLLRGVDEMHYSAQPRLVLETTLMKAVQAGKVVPITSIIERIDTLLAGAGPAPGIPDQAPAPVEKKIPRSLAAVAAPLPRSQPKAAAPPQAGESVPPEPGPSVSARPGTPPVAQSPPTRKEIRKQWDEFIDYVQERKKWMGLALRLSSGIYQEQGRLNIKFDDQSDCKRLQDPDNRKVLTEFFLDFFQQEMRLNIMVQGQDLAGENGDTGLTLQQERRALANDPLVEMTTEIFDGQVSNIRTGPRSR